MSRGKKWSIIRKIVRHVRLGMVALPLNNAGTLRTKNRHSSREYDSVDAAHSLFLLYEIKVSLSAAASSRRIRLVFADNACEWMHYQALVPEVLVRRSVHL